LQTTYKSVKFLAPIGGFIAAIFFHFMWNLSASFGEAFFVVYLVMMMPALVCVLLLIYFSLRREGRIVREHLFIEFQSGRISQVDYECVTNAWRRMGALRRAFFKGLTPWRTRRKFHQLASELAFHRDRINRGVCKRTQETDAIEYAYVEQIVYIVGPPMQASNTPPPIPRR
ncbi:MAG TPA: hypothetical protein PK402_13440, partial [Tepidisphaeraceae bacterium]|nr:hypothetical protein [Tepidisphaeraceae bacterium]